MTQRPFEPGTGLGGRGDSVLTTIREDMEVYDVHGDHVGEVEFVYLGSSSPTGIERGTGPATADDIDLTADTLVEVVARAFSDDDIPDVLRRRLLYNGFVKVDGEGLFASDRFVMADQIASVSGERVLLKVDRKQLIKD